MNLSHDGNNVDSNAGSNDIEEGFQTVSYKRHRKPLFGTKTRTIGSSGIAGERTPRLFSLFVGGLKKNLTVNELHQYIVDNMDVTPESIEINKTNEYNRSFKITVQHKDKGILFTPTNWEENIIIKPFRINKNVPSQ